MYILVLITIITCLIAFAHDLVKPLKYFLNRPTATQLKFQAEIDALRKELSKLSMQDNYIEYVKLERKIVSAQMNKAEDAKKSFVSDLVIKYGLGYVAQAALFLVLVFISIWYRYTPVIVFDEKFNFAPFGAIIRFPTGISNAISVPFWIFVSNFTFRSLASYIKS